jgi:integrase
VTKFLEHLFVDKNLAASTITGYSSTISQTLAMMGGADIGHDRVVSHLIKAYKIARPRSLKTVPQWNLAYVLQALTIAPYEPLKNSSILHLTCKTLLLLLLASAKRLGEVHAIDMTRIQWKEDGSMVYLYPLMGFIPKSASAAEGRPRFQPIAIPALTNITGDDPAEPDTLLCPVRALKLYLKRTSAFRNNRKRLFIHDDPRVHTDVMKNKISSWVRQTIIEAYRSAPEEYRQLNSITTHEIRAIAASLNVHATFALENLMSHCTWRNATTFTSYYLRDATTLVGDMRCLGPVCAAGAIILP